LFEKNKMSLSSFCFNILWSLNVFQVTVKIQECEATLLLATDKGERIAEEGSAFDRNNITQQLQSLKQQLITLRKAVEKERQKLEATAAEHIKLATDLEQVLDWIRENEALVKSRPLLEININSVDAEQKAHEVLSKHLNKLLNNYKNQIGKNIYNRFKRIRIKKKNF